MSPMMRLLLGIGALVVILAGVAIGLPSHVNVSRSVVINAPESAVYPYLNTMRNFSDWSPWRIRDPNLQMTFSGPAQGKGAHVDWVSEVKAIGTGSLEIADGDPNRNIDLVANINGVEGTSNYTITPAGSGSRLTWSFSYDTGVSPLKRWRGAMLDGLIGPEYNAGLQKLKASIEDARRPHSAPPAAAPPAMAPPPGQSVPRGAAPAAPEAAPEAPPRLIIE
ncbi:MAG: SRPBCC family protein [Methyloceanibacter sp.]